MSSEKEFVEVFIKNWGNIKALDEMEKEEKSTMKVTYNGFTGELVKLEQEDLRAYCVKDRTYKLSIYDSEHQVTHSFTGVKPEDVKFSGGVMIFGG